MPTLLDLPVELHLMINSAIPLNDIEQFSLCCKVIHQRSEKRLMEQYARRRHYSTVAVGHIDNRTWDEDQQIRGVHPLSVLRDLIVDPRARLYVKTLIVGSIEGTDPVYFGDQDEAELDALELQDLTAQLKHDARLLRVLLDLQRLLDPDSGEIDLEQYPESKNWTGRILSGGMEAAASLLILMLPNLQKLRLVEGFRIWGYPFLTTVKQLIRAAKSNRHKLTGINSFSKLTELGMIGVREGCGANYGVSRGFLVLPSLRTIKGRFIDGHRRSPFPGCLEGPSQVSSLEFRQSVISGSSFDSMLNATRGLQSFVYDFWAGAIRAEQLWQPRQIVGVLKTYNRKNLSNLELTSLAATGCAAIGNLQYIDFKQVEPFIGSLCAFEVLQTIRVETMMLYKKIEGADAWTQEEISTFLEQRRGEASGMKWPRDADLLVEQERLVDILPKSTRQLKLVGGLSNEDATAMLGDLPVLKDEL